MVNASDDAKWMDHALRLAERGRGTTSPNPMVGAVVVSPAGAVVGEGAHERAGGPHAEVLALDAAAGAARGATLYCNLEPCTHVGRTGPCAPRIADAGIARVVAAMVDPNPVVSGSGLGYLRAKGISVTVGVGESAARRLNAPFVTWITLGRPFVTAKISVSSDGFVAIAGGRTDLSGDEANRFFHRQRAEVDAIAVGADTVIIDDPLLTARDRPRARQLTRVLFDWRARISPGSKVFSTLSEGPVIIAVRRAEAEAAPERIEALRAAGATVESFEDRDVLGVLRFLARQDVTWLLLEGGPVLHQAFIDAGLVDSVQRLSTGVALGDGVREAAGLLSSRPPDHEVRETVLGPDRLTEWDVHRTD